MHSALTFLGWILLAAPVGQSAQSVVPADIVERIDSESGSPYAVTYLIEEAILLTVFQTSEGQACLIEIGSEHPSDEFPGPPLGKVQALLDSLLRGVRKKQSAGLSRGSCGGLSSAHYDGADVVTNSFDCGPDGTPRFLTASIRFLAAPECQDLVEERGRRRLESEVRSLAASVAASRFDSAESLGARAQMKKLLERSFFAAAFLQELLSREQDPQGLKRLRRAAESDWSGYLDHVAK